jgi:Ca-activated chloride channel family protein
MKSMVNVETTEGVEAVTDTALTYQLLSQYTAFVAVSDDVRINPESVSLSMQVPVEMPEGVSHYGVFSPSTSGGVQIPQSRSSYQEDTTVSDTSKLSMSIKSKRISSSTEASLSLDSRIPASPPVPATGLSGKVKDAVGKIFNQNQLTPNPPEDRKSPSPSPSQLKIISVTGLEAAATASLTQYLQKLSLPVGFSGEIMFEFPVQKGRVKRIMLDEKASTLKEATVIDLIKRSLLSWQVPQSVTGTIRLTLRINS